MMYLYSPKNQTKNQDKFYGVRGRGKRKEEDGSRYVEKEKWKLKKDRKIGGTRVIRERNKAELLRGINEESFPIERLS